MKFTEKFFAAIREFEDELSKRAEILLPEEAVELFFTEERCKKLSLVNVSCWKRPLIQLLAADGYEFEQEYADEEFYATEG